AAAARQGRPTRCGPRRSRRLYERAAGAAAIRTATRGAAAPARCPTQRRRRPPRVTRAAAQRDRDRARCPARRAAWTARPPPTRPDDTGLHRATRRRRKEPPRRHPTAQALPRPPPLPATAEPGAADGLTSHRSIIPARSRRLGSPPLTP